MNKTLPVQHAVTHDHAEEVLAKQLKQIKRGSYVRSYDFPGDHDDFYIEGYVTEVDREMGRVRIHVIKDVVHGKEVKLVRWEVTAPLGVGLFSGEAAVHYLGESHVAA